MSILTERLDHHRGRGQQQITVKHVTVNAEQAVVTDQVVAGKPESISPTALTAVSEQPMQMLAETRQTEPVGRGKGQK